MIRFLIREDPWDGEIIEIKLTQKDLLADLAVQVAGAEVDKR